MMDGMQPSSFVTMLLVEICKEEPCTLLEHRAATALLERPVMEITPLYAHRKYSNLRIGYSFGHQNIHEEKVCHSNLYV